MHFLNLAELANLDQNEPFSKLKTMISRKYSYQKLTQLAEENNVLDSAVSTICGFLWRDTFVSQLS
jgi:hypothetical protein